MSMCNVWVSPIQKQRPTSTPKNRILPHPTTAQMIASWRRTIRSRWRRKRRWRHALHWMSLTPIALWNRRTLYWVGLGPDRWVLLLPARAVPLPPGNTSCSTLSVSLPGTAVWPTLLPQYVATSLPTSSAFLLPPLRHMTARLGAAPRAEGAAGGRRASRTAPPRKATHPYPYRLLTTKSWSAPLAALASLRPRKTSLGLLSFQGQQGEQKQAPRPFLDSRCVPESDPS